ncbi:hypothetical protein [Mycoplasmopsis felis]|uniref:hypothetical protein n=1 Tax=Mycoplasmopsis felis TaxID=33923 RepID=UPI0021AF0256|nr:hypothetical protein [Mycoplasmopsis felis]UWV83969.1 hypothetical protein NWE58_00205 [Mycoplasmopsis felis]
MSGENYDDELVKAYFANALKQYSDYLNLGWEVETEHLICFIWRSRINENC